MTEDKGKPVYYMKEGGIPYMRANFVSYPEKGGTLANIEGVSVPYKGMPDLSILYALDILKRLLKLNVKFILKRWYLIPFILPNWRILLKNFNELSEVNLRRFNIILERYCDTARELIRVGDKVIKDLDFLEIFMIVVTFYEYDWAYRTRSHKILSLINKDDFKNNPYKELKRLLAELHRREGDESVREKYNIFGKLIWLAKIPRIRKVLVDFVEEMDMTIFAPDDTDLFWWGFNKSADGRVEFDFS